MIMANFISTSVELNGIFHPARNAEKVLAGYTRPLFVWSDDVTYKFYWRGSSTRILYRERYYIICSRHQVADLQLDDVAMLKDDGSHLVTSSRVIHFKDNWESDVSDVIAFDVTKSCEMHPGFKSSFFHFLAVPPDAPSDATVCIQLTGYPSERQIYELYDNHIGLRKHQILCKLDSQPSDDAILKLRSSESLTFDPNGMSGGSAFTIQMVNGRAIAYFAGIILRGGRDNFYILKSGCIKSFLEAGSVAVQRLAP